MKKVLENIIITIILIFTIIMSILLLSYNEFKVSVIGNKTILINDEDALDFKSGSLLVVEKKKNESYESGDYIFYYDTSKNQVQTQLSPVIDLYDEVQGEKSYVVGDDLVVNETYIIGKSTNTKEYKKLGKVLGILESKWGNLFLVVVPAFLLFLYEIYNLAYVIKTFKKRRYKKVLIEDDEEVEE